ncbi:MAG: tetratricopeptide repeat protein [Nitrosomonadales bacterium]|nr:tetratricopeptide repeat protein [Nitrosomonadales bacterium]
MTQFKYILLCSLLLTACAHAPQQPKAAVQDDQAEAESQAEPQAEVPQVLPNVELSGELLYEFMLTEIASQRGNDALAVTGSVDLAKKTQDPRLAMRAAHLALQFGQIDKALEALRIWRNTDPASIMARRMLSSVLLRSGNTEAAGNEFADLLKVDEKHAAQNFIQIFQMLAAYPNKAEALKLLRGLAQPYPRVAEARWGVAQLAQASGDAELALNEAKQAHSLRPEWDRAASLEAQLLQKNAPQQGLEVLRSYLSSYPDAHEIRLQYARTLLDQKQYKLARDEFQRIADENPENPDLAYAIALISLQLSDWENAEIQLKQALSKGKKEQDTVQYYLGQLSEAKKKEEEAIAYYREVKGGEFQVAAHIRIAYLLSKRGQLAEARQLLHQVHVTNDLPRAQLSMVEAQLLREASQFDDAYQVLSQALARLPDQIDLIYETAMMADKIGKFDEFEKLMRKLIKIKPDHAQAYNALGYSMLERNDRIPEAVELVEKALQLAPDDVAIMDSVGWGYYLSGKLDESVKMLRRAFAGDANPEIAAHLGEVLWVRGDKEEAKKIWQNSLKENSGNKPLQAVIQKFDP